MNLKRLDHITSMLLKAPDDSFLLFALAKEYEGLGQLKKAVEVYEKLRLSNPDYTGLYYHLANNYGFMGQGDKAIELYEKGIEICEKMSDHHALQELKNAYLNFQMERDIQ